MIDTLRNYHPVIGAFAMVGLVIVECRLQAWIAITSTLAIAQALVYDVPWVTMTPFRFVYRSAVRGSRERCGVHPRGPTALVRDGSPRSRVWNPVVGLRW